MRASRNVFPELAGSHPTSGFTEMAVREVGAERLIYGSDVAGRSLASQLAKIMGADIPESAKALILGGNLRRILTPILKRKGYRATLRTDQPQRVLFRDRLGVGIAETRFAHLQRRRLEIEQREVRAEHDALRRDFPRQHRDSAHAFHHCNVKVDLPGCGDFLQTRIALLIQNQPQPWHGS